MKSVQKMFRATRQPQPQPPKSVVLMFDFDGVVADSFEVFYAEFTGAMQELGWDKLNSRESLLKLMEGNPLAGLVKMGFPVWRLKQLGEKFAPRIEAAHARVEPFEGMPYLLTELALVHPTYVITSNQTRAVEQFLERHGIGGVREVIGADKETSKVKKILSVKKIHPESQGWYVGDTKGDMIEAGLAGAVSVAVTWGWHTEATLAEGKPHHVVHDQSGLRDLLINLPGASALEPAGQDG